MRAPLGVGLRMNWLFVVKKRRAAGSRPMIVVPWSANTKLAPNRLRRDHIGSCALIDIFWHHLLEQDFLGVWHTLLRNGRYTTKWRCHAVAGCWPVGSRTGAVFRRSSLAVAPRFLATQRDHKLRQNNLRVVSARDELRQTIAILGWQEHRWQKERLCNFGHLHHGGLQSGRVTCAMAILRQSF